MSVMMIWTLGVDPTRIDEVHELVAARREQVQRHSCAISACYRVIDSAHDGIRMIAIEEFETRATSTLSANRSRTMTRHRRRSPRRSPPSDR